MFVVRKLRQFFNVSQNYSDVFARFVCCTSIRNDFRFHSGLFKMLWFFQEFKFMSKLIINFAHKVFYLRRNMIKCFESKHVEGFIPLSDFQGRHFTKYFGSAHIR